MRNFILDKLKFIASEEGQHVRDFSFRAGAALFAVIAAIYTAKEYNESSRISRVDRLYDLAKEWDSEAQVAADRAFFDYKVAIAEKDESRIKDLWLDYQFGLYLTFGHYNKAAFCVKSGACDSNAAVSLYGSATYEFITTHFDLICNQRKISGYEDYGQPVIEVLARPWGVKIDEELVLKNCL